MRDNRLWVKWFNQQTTEDKHTIALAAIERLIEADEVRFRIDDSVRIDGSVIPEDEVVDECLFWTATGEDLRNP